MAPSTSSLREPVALLVATGVILNRSGIRPFDHVTWWLEVAPVPIATSILVYSYSAFRCSPLTRGRWLFLLVVCVCLTASAFYELIEWWAALIGGHSADFFLATQGDVWDTQWEVFLALVGAISGDLLLARAHARSLAAIGFDPQSPST